MALSNYLLNCVVFILFLSNCYSSKPNNQNVIHNSVSQSLNSNSLKPDKPMQISSQQKQEQQQSNDFNNSSLNDVNPDYDTYMPENETDSETNMTTESVNNQLKNTSKLNFDDFNNTSFNDSDYELVNETENIANSDSYNTSIIVNSNASISSLNNNTEFERYFHKNKTDSSVGPTNEFQNSTVKPELNTTQNNSNSGSISINNPILEAFKPLRISSEQNQEQKQITDIQRAIQTTTNNPYSAPFPAYKPLQINSKENQEQIINFQRFKPLNSFGQPFEMAPNYSPYIRPLPNIFMQQQQQPFNFRPLFDFNNFWYYKK